MTTTTQSLKDLEDLLFTLNENNKLAINHSNTMLMESIYKVGSESQIASKSFDDSLYEIFPDIDSCVIGTPEIFNPGFVVEMKDGKGYSIIENWDTTKGLLPDRKVIGYYDITLYMNIETFNNNVKNIRQTTPCFTFELDNYMNMYSKSHKFYILINKTSFPLYPFYMFYKHFNMYPRYERYLLKPNLYANNPGSETINFLEPVNYTKRDNRELILSNVHYLVHPQYKDLLEFVEKFRNFSEYKFGSPGANIKETENTTENKKEVYSAQSKIIKGLENKLNEILVKYKSASQFIEEITGKFNDSLVQITQKNRELDLKNTQILKLEHRIVETSKTLELEKSQSISELNMEHERTVMALKQKLMEAECFKAQCSSLEITMDDVKNDLSEAKLQIQREKDSNRGLLNQIINEKETLSKVKNDNEELLNTISEYTKLNKNMERVNNDNELMIEKLKKDNKFLSDQVSQKYNEKNDELFKALNQRIKELEKEVKDVNVLYEKTKTDKKTLETELGTIKQVLSKIK
jgi:hypothetical protein